MTKQRPVYAARRPLRRLEAAWGRLESRIDRLSTLAARLRPYNPLYHLGQLTIFLLIYLTLTGVYLTLLYRPGETRAFESVAAISATWFGSIMRTSHRYAADALILVAFLHAGKAFLSDRFWGSRWLAWVSGWIIVLLFWAVGTMGYFLVWDDAAQWLTQYSLDRLGGSFTLAFLGPDSAARTFSFFIIILFLHVFMPLILALGVLVHVLRLARARYWAPRWLMISSALLLVLLSLALPVANGAPADVNRMLGRMTIDWWYLGFLPLIDWLGDPLFWGLSFLVIGLIIALPWLLRGQHLGPAQVINASCTGCALCARECPYDAIEMVHRDDETKFASLAVVKPNACTGCGVCVAACNDDAIELQALHSRVVRQDLRRAVRRADPARAPVVIYTCDRHAALGTLPQLTPAAALPALDLRAAGASVQPGLPPRVETGTWPDHAGQPQPVMTATVPCMGMLHPNWAVETINAGAAATIMVTCPAHDCAYREGPQWVEHRMHRKRTLRSGSVHHIELAPGSRQPLLGLWNQVLAAQPGDPPLPTAISQQKDTPPPRVALLGQGRRLAPGLALLLITLVLALLPIRPAGSAPVTGELHVLLNHDNALLTQTNNLPPKIAAKLPPNVDPAMILGGERFPVDLLIRIDGETLAQRSYRPSGLRREGASQATEKWPIAAGSHQVQIDLRDDGAVWRTVFDATLDFGVGESVNLYYEGERDAFLRRE